MDQLSDNSRTLTTKVETAEAAQKRAEQERDTEKAARTALEEKAARTSQAASRMTALGTGFLAKLGDTSKAVLSELAASASDESWDLALREREELAGVKRDDAAASAKPADPAGSQSFSSEEVASFLGRVTPPASGAAPAQDGTTSVRQLARSFASKGR